MLAARERIGRDRSWPRWSEQSSSAMPVQGRSRAAQGSAGAGGAGGRFDLREGSLDHRDCSGSSLSASSFSKSADAFPWISITRRALANSPSAFSARRRTRSEEHTPELQSRQYLVCRLL